MALSLEPGFLDFDNLPDTNFSCVGKVIGGYYADLETNCQMFHVCTIGQLDEPMDIKFLCLNGTVFDQETRVCERIDEVDCTKSEQFYSLNLELYGHSHSSNIEENSETEQPLIIKSTLPTTTTTTPPPRKTTRAPYYSSVTPPTTTTLGNRLASGNNHNPTRHSHISTGNNHTPTRHSHISTGSKHTHSSNNHHHHHHFPVLNPSATDIRFNPEEINISLHPGAPPDIRTKAVSYYSDKKVTDSENQLVVTTHRAVFDDSRRETLNTGSSTQRSRYNSGTPSDFSEYGFTYRQEDSVEYTEPPESFRIRTEFRPSQEYAAALQNHNPQLYKSSTFRTDYASSSPKVNNYQQQKASTTISNYFVHSLKPPPPNQQSHYGGPHTEKSPQRIQLPLPLLPTLPPLTFSSPAPFSLQQRNEQKRYTKDHIPPPRIVISASASVSDASGRRLNYSLGTIGAAQIFKPPPRSYDEYKDEDVALDPFYLDVPKVSKSSRRKRSTHDERIGHKSNDERKIDYSDIIKNDDEALHVLKFLFDWYKNEKTNPARLTTPISTPLDTEGISSINDGLAPETESSRFDESKDDDSLDLIFKTSDSFDKKTKYSLINDDGLSVSHEEERKINNVQEKYTIEHELEPDKDELFQHEEDYVNDNYEPLTYKERDYKENEKPNYSKTMEKFVYSEEKKNYSVPDDYIDDNIEPIFYKERDSGRHNKEIRNYSDKSVLDQNNNNHPEKTTNTKKDYDSNLNSDYSSQVEDRKETTVFITTEHPEEQKSTNELNVDGPTPLSMYEIKNTLTTERIPFTTTVARTDRRKNTRGSRKFNDSVNKKEKETALLDKLVKQPYRAKDDYDYLRTIRFQTSTSIPSFETTETDFIPTITESPSFTSTPSEPMTQKTIVEIVTTIKESEEFPDTYTLTTSTTTTERPKRKSKTRRGKHKYTDYLSEESGFRRKTPQTSPKSTEIDYDSNLSVQSEENKSKISSEHADLSEDTDLKQSRREKQSAESNNDQEPYSDMLEATTKGTKRGKSKFIDQELVKEMIDTSTSNNTDLSRSTYSTSKDKVFSDKMSVQDSYEDIYATSFVPTTESIHITKKKQLKENLLNVLNIKLETTTNNYEYTTGDAVYSSTRAQGDLKKAIEDIESNTKSVVATKIYKQLTTEPMTETESTTTTLDESVITEATILKENLTMPFITTGMHLVGVSVEKQEKKLYSEEENITEDIPVTTEVIEFNTNINIQNLEFEKLSMKNLITEIDKMKPENKKYLHDKEEALTKENILKNEETTTEIVQSTEGVDSTSDVPETWTIKLESTTNSDKYTQIPTTFEQTTIESSTEAQYSTETSPVTTTESTTTLRPRRKGGKPTRKRSETQQRSGYKHRFGSNQFTRRPKSRKQTIEDEIVDIISRTGTESTTESFRTPTNKKNYVLTDYPLRKSVNPTQAERTLVTTPFPQNPPTKRQFFFNCFGKEIDKFYPDLRDCRLFHYCTQGYSKNQLLDLKFVCDLKTYFDDEKLICTKTKPKRCL